jgi:hypothetical protein
MSGERFSVLYVRPGDPAPDSCRARHRVGSLFREAIFGGHTQTLAAYLARHLGLDIPGEGKHPSCWYRFIRECPIADFLDIVTVVHRYLFWHVGDKAADAWRDALRQIFAQENLSYEIDDAGGVHPRVDREFQRNMASTIAGLQSEHYQDVRASLERAASNLSAEPPNCRQAWRATLSAVETLFSQMFPHARLTVDEIDRRLLPLVQRVYQRDLIAQKAARSMVASFREWLEVSQHYRHQPGAADGAQPPADLAILSISCGSSLLRWLAGLHEAATTKL